MAEAKNPTFRQLKDFAAETGYVSKSGRFASRKELLIWYHQNHVEKLPEDTITTSIIHEMNSDEKGYTGESKNGKRHGQGRMVYPDNQIYEGSWRDDKRCGKGILHLMDGRVY